MQASDNVSNADNYNNSIHILLYIIGYNFKKHN